MVRNALLGLTFVAFCTASSSVWGQGTTFYAKQSADWAKLTWYSDNTLKTPAEGTPGEVDKVYLGKGTVTIKDGDIVTLHGLRLDAITTSEACTIDQTGGTVTLKSADLPSSYDDESKHPALYVGRQGGGSSSAIYNLKGGTLSAREGYLYIGGGSWTNQFNLSGGLLRAKGIRGSGFQEFVFNQTGGTMVLGEGGFTVPAKDTTGRVATFSGGVFAVGEDAVLDVSGASNASISNKPVFAAHTGKTMTLKGTFSGSGTLVIGSAEPIDEVACDGTVDLSGAKLSIGGVELAAGTAVLGTHRGLKLSVPEGGMAEGASVTFRLTAAEEAAGLSDSLFLAVPEDFAPACVTVYSAADAATPAGGEVQRLANGTLVWVKEALPEVSFTVPEAWGYTPVDLPQEAKAYTASGTFSLYAQADATQTLNGRKAVVGQLSGTSGDVFGGKPKASKTNPAGIVEGDIWLKVTGGDYGTLAGGSDASGWKESDGAGQSIVKGNILLSMEGGSANTAMGAFFKDGVDIATVEGNVALVVEKDAVLKGAATGAGLLAHGNGQKITGSSLLWVRNFQGAPTAPATTIHGDENVFCGGPLYDTNTASTSNVEGGSALIVEVPQEASGDFARILVGGAVSTSSAENKTHQAGKDVVLTVAKQSSVHITAPEGVAFTQAIVGGGMAGTDLNPKNGGAAKVEGDASVTLEGGTYKGTIVAGGYGNNATVSGTATLTLKGGDFAEATVKPGNANGVATLRVQCPATIKDFTAFDVLDFTTGGTAALTVTERFTLPEGATMEVRFPADADVGSELPLTLPSATDPAVAARLKVTLGNRRYDAVLSEGKLSAKAPTVTFSRPATAAWAEAELTLSGVPWVQTSSSLYLEGQEAYDVTTEGETTVSAARVESLGKGLYLFGGMRGVSNAGDEPVILGKPIRLQVAGGNFQRVHGGSDVSGWNSGTNYKSHFKGDILVEMAGGTTDYLSAASWSDGKNQTYEGNLATVLTGNAVVTGSVSGAGGSQHNYTCTYGSSEKPVEVSVTVRNVQNDNTSTLVYTNAEGGPRVGAIVGGAVWSVGKGMTHAIHGNTAVVVELPDDTATDTPFGKQLIGGFWLDKPVKGNLPEAKSAKFSISQGTQVSVTAPAALRFTKDITGGSWMHPDMTPVAIPLGATAVTLNGGIYEGTVTAGSLGVVADKLGPATLTIGEKGATFKGMVQGGLAESKELVLDGSVTLEGGTLDLTTFSALSGTGALTLAAGELKLGKHRASNTFGVLHVSSAADGTITATCTDTETGAITLPVVGETLTPEAFKVYNAVGVEVPIAECTATEAGTTLTFKTVEAPLTAANVQGEGLTWSDLAWQDAKGGEVELAVADAWTGARSVETAGDAEVTLTKPVVAEPMTFAGSGKLTLSATGGATLKATTVAVNADVALAKGAAKLSGVTIAEGKTLTVKDATTVDLIAANAVKGAGTLRMEDVTVVREARPVEGEAKLEVGQGATLTLAANGESQISAPLTVSGTGVLVLQGKDVIGWNPSKEQLRNTCVIAREQGIVRAPSGVVESMRCTYEMGGSSRLEVGKVTENESGAYATGFDMCRGARFIATDGSAGIYGLAGEANPAIALRCTATGATIAGTNYAFVEFEVRPGATFTVDVPLRHYANGEHSNFPVRKRGAGTLVLTKANPTTGNPLIVEAGTVRFAQGASWDEVVTLKGTLGASGAATVAALTLAEGAALDASEGVLSVTGAMTLAGGAQPVPVTLSEDAKVGDVVLACAAPVAEVASALKAEGFTVVAVAEKGYVLASAEPMPKVPEAFDTATLAQLRKDAVGLTDGFTVEVRDPKGAFVGSEERAAAILACFQGVECAANPTTNVLTYTYAFGITAAKADATAERVAVTVSIRGGALRPGTVIQLVAADAEAETSDDALATVLASQAVPSADAPAIDLTLTVPIDNLTRPFKAKVVAPAQEP